MLNDFNCNCPIYLASGYTDLIKSGEGFAGLLQSYNILTGNTWILVVLSALISPMLVMKIKGRK